MRGPEESNTSASRCLTLPSMTLIPVSELDLPDSDIPSLAERLKVSERTIRRRVKAGKIPHHRLGNLIRFTRQDIRDFIDQSKVPMGSESGFPHPT